MNNNKYLEMTAEDQAFAEEFKRWRDADSAGALRLLRWLQRNFDPAAHACTTCGDSVRHLFARCTELWSMFAEEIQAAQKPKKRTNGKKTTNG